MLTINELIEGLERVREHYGNVPVAFFSGVNMDMLQLATVTGIVGKNGFKYCAFNLAKKEKEFDKVKEMVFKAGEKVNNDITKMQV